MPITHKSVSIGGLITNVRYEERVNARRFRGLPDCNLVVGRTGLAIITVEGIVTAETNISGLSSKTGSAISVSGAGKSVVGFVTELNLRGTFGEPVTFSVTVAGKPGSGGGGGGGGCSVSPTSIVFLEDTNFKGAYAFNLSLSWDYFFFYDPDGDDWPYPDLNNSFIRGFEGTLTVEGASLSGGSLGEKADWSVSAGGITIAGEGISSGGAASDSPDDLPKSGYKIFITSIG